MIRRRASSCRRNDRGSSMAAVLIVMMVVLAIGLASVTTARHSNDVTSHDRERLQTIESAEAGIHSALARAESGLCDLSTLAKTALRQGDEVVGEYRTRIDPEAGMTCAASMRRVITSWGYAPTGGTRALRKVQVGVELKPNAGFSYALFAEGGTGTVYVKNNAQINGDVYAEVLDQSKTNLSARDVVSPDSIAAQNNATYSATVWSGGSVSMGQGSNVGGSVLASGTKPSTSGNVTFGNGGFVGGDVLAKGVISVGSTTVQGAQSASSPHVPAPPDLEKPTFTWNAASYASPVVDTAANITSLLETNKSALSGTYYNTSGTASSITIPDNARVTGDLTIVSSGRVILGSAITATSGPWEVVIVAESTASNAIDVNRSMTSASGVHLLLWSAGGVDIKNNAVMTGAIYADSIDIKNGLTVTHPASFATFSPPGFTFSASSVTAYTAVPTLWRELTPDEPTT